MVDLQTQRLATEACFFSRYMIITLDDDAHKACQEPMYFALLLVRSFYLCVHIKAEIWGRSVHQNGIALC